MIYIILMIIAFFLLILIRIPIPYALLISTLIYFLGADISTNIIIVRLVRSFDAFILLAIPAFILSGKIMAVANITDRLIAIADLIVGRLKGSLAYVNIVVSMFFGGITGTAISDTTAIGSILIPTMVKEGYSKRFSAAVTAASSTMGPVIPPSLMFIIYGSIANVSIRDLFLAGTIPGILIGVFQMIVVKIVGSRSSFPRRTQKIPFTKGIRIMMKGLPALLLPIMIMVPIITGMATPTEAAVVASFYSAFIALLLYRTMRVEMLIKVIKDSAFETGSVSIILASAALFGWALSSEQIPQQFAHLLIDNIHNKILILLLINIMLLVLGCFMDGIPAIMIVTPVLMPLFRLIGMDPLQAGVFMCINLTVGISTPPVGCCLFAASIIANESIENVSTALIPFLVSNFIVVLLVTYIPFLSMFIPSLIK